MSDETVLLQSDGVFKWDGPKRKQTLIKAKLGRLVLTDRRLVFLSTGSNDLSAMRLLAGARRPSAVFDVSSTGSLDLTALTNEGAIDVPVDRLRGAELHGMFKVLTIRWVAASGAEEVATFAEKNAGMPGGPQWVAHIERMLSQHTPAAVPLDTAAATAAASGWFADPLGRHELRYWDGATWTEHVADAGAPAIDPIQP
jgi:hypothetical protein